MTETVLNRSETALQEIQNEDAVAVEEILLSIRPCIKLSLQYHGWIFTKVFSAM